MILPWRIERQLTVFFVVLGAIAGIALFLYWRSIPVPTCTDGKRNQEEEGIDCGGQCKPCIKQPKDLVTLWTRVLEVRDGVYDVASLVENTNLFYAMPLFKYTFKIYDKNNVTLGLKEGQTFFNPQSKFVIFASGIEAKGSKPTRADMYIDYLSDWKYADTKSPSVVVSQKKFSNDQSVLLQVDLYNQSVFPVENIEAAAVLYDENGNAMAASVSKAEIIKGEISD